MDVKEQEYFRGQFKSIVYKKHEIELSNKRLRNLHAWDKNGSHEKAILKELDVRAEISAKLVKLLDGKSYEDWKLLSKKLSALNSRLKLLNAKKYKVEYEIDRINF